MNSKFEPNEEQKKIFEDIAERAITQTLKSLSKITAREWNVLNREMHFCDIKSAWKLFPFDDVMKFGGELVYSGEMPMSFVCIFPQKSVADLTGYINKKSKLKQKGSSLAETTIAEVSNILTNSFLGVVANILKMRMLIAMPSVSVGSRGYLFKKAISKAGVEKGYVLSSELFLESDDLAMKATFVVVMSENSFKKLIGKVESRQ